MDYWEKTLFKRNKKKKSKQTKRNIKWFENNGKDIGTNGNWLIILIPIFRTWHIENLCALNYFTIGW